LPDDPVIEDIPQTSRIGTLVNKIVLRNKEIEKAKLALQDIYDKEGKNIKNAMEQLGLDLSL
jgi:hypothetical protein